MQNKVIDKNLVMPDDFKSGRPHHAQHEEKILYLESRIKRLGTICNDLNPYSPITDEFKKSLREFNILEFEDPFKITNALLMLLEDAIDELHVLKPLSQEESLQEKLR